MGKHFGNLCTGYAVLFGKLQVVGERRINNSLAHKGGDSNHATIVRAESRAVPYFPEKDIVIQFCEFGCKFPQLCAPGSLCNLFLCHHVLNINC